jgi:hypothetical protein
VRIVPPSAHAVSIVMPDFIVSSSQNELVLSSAHAFFRKAVER